MKKLYSRKGNYVRFRSPENIVKEINLLIKNYPTKYLIFLDDTINSNKMWFLDFLNCYKQNFTLPLVLVCRIDLLDEEIIKAMKEAKVDRVSIAIEHGNEQYRREILKRNMNNSLILENCALLKKYRIRIHISNMIGLPAENLELAFETLELNQKIKPNFSEVCVFQPYEGTQLYQYAVDNNLQIKKVWSMMTWGTNDTVVNNPSIRKEDAQLINLHSFFSLLVYHSWLLFFIKPLLEFKPNKYFEFFSGWYYFKVRYKYSANNKEKIIYVLQLTKYILPSWLQNKLEKYFNNKIIV